MDLRHHFSDVICVSCSQETQIKRIKQRNHTIEDHEILSMLAVQKSNHYKESHSSIIINNDENDENYTVLKTEVQKIAAYLKKRLNH
ncbi:MAG: dephospho-CoA kinase [Candidatus Sericytochromatia bacterium]|nr:dephospho-CoA kinase [Candidatus Sericytochromatia bacterium]